MCSGFGMIFWRDGAIEFIEPGVGGDVSHSDILERSKKKAIDTYYNRNFVRIEFPKWTSESYRLDVPTYDIPGWVDQEEVKEKATKLFLRILPLYIKYKIGVGEVYPKYSSYATEERTAWVSHVAYPEKGTPEEFALAQAEDDRLWEIFDAKLKEGDSLQNAEVEVFKTEFLTEMRRIRGYLRA